MWPHHQTTILATIIFIFPSYGQAGSSCASDFTLCAPQGATSEKIPQIGTSAFESLFIDIVLSSLPASIKEVSTASLPSFCCQSTMSCLLMANLEIPFCYDPFTTDFFLPDGSYGTVVGGVYNSSSGDLANLLSGQYTFLNGSTGNIYSNSEAPNTATLPMPSQYTASGTGSAIPASALGDEVTLTYTTTLLGTIIPPSTIPLLTIPAITTSETIILQSVVSAQISGMLVVSTSIVETISAATIEGTTISSQTVPARTIEPTVMTITLTMAGTPKSTTAATTGAKKNEARGWKPSSHVASFLALILTYML